VCLSSLRSREKRKSKTKSGSMDMGRWIYIRRERVCASIEKVKTEWYIYTGWCLFVLFTLFYSLLSFFFFFLLFLSSFSLDLERGYYDRWGKDWDKTRSCLSIYFVVVGRVKNSTGTVFRECRDYCDAFSCCVILVNLSFFLFLRW